MKPGRPQLLTSESILDTALQLIDDEGLDALSIRRLSTDLGVSHMTVYGYFANKDALLEAVVARTIEVPATVPDTARTWDENLNLALHEIRAALVARPGIAELLVTQNFDGEWVARVRDKLLALLAGAGYDEATTVDALSVLFNYLLGDVLIEASRARGGSPTSFDLGLDLLISGLRERAPQ